MLMKGSKIKLKKEIPAYENTPIKVGDVFEVTGIDESGSIIFKSDYGFGMMGYTEFENYFEECKKESEWKEQEEEFSSRDIFEILESSNHHYKICYQTDNERTVKVVLNMIDSYGNVIHSYYGKAHCDPFDKFDFCTGYRIALLRAFSSALLYSSTEEIHMPF